MKKKINKFILITTFLTFLITSLPLPGYAQYFNLPNYLVERGIGFYAEGEYDEAFDSFKKALLLNPHGNTAQVCKMYMELIKEQLVIEEEIEIFKPSVDVEERLDAEKLKAELAIREYEQKLAAEKRKAELAVREYEEKLAAQKLKADIAVKEREQRRAIEKLKAELAAKEREKKIAIKGLEKELELQKTMLQALEKEREEMLKEKAAKPSEPAIHIEEIKPIVVEKTRPVEIEEIKPIIVEKARPIEPKKIERPVAEVTEEKAPAEIYRWPEEAEAVKGKEVVVPIIAQLEGPKRPKGPQEREIEEIAEEVRIEKARMPEVKKPLEIRAPEQEVAEVAARPKFVPVKEEAPIEILREKLVLAEDIGPTQVSPEIELELHKGFVVQGDNISRWLNTAPEVIEVTRRDADTIEIAGKKISSTFVHVWDDAGRWTLNIKVISPKYIRQLAEKYRKELEQVKPFKFGYSWLRNSFHRGEGGRPSSLERETLTFNQWLTLDGETPYGTFDALAKISKLRETTDLTQFTMGLRDASVMGIEDFDIRGFDFSAAFSGLTFPGESMRGVRFDKRAFEKELDYTMFWGRTGQGKFGRLSPGLADPKDEYIYGSEFRFHPLDNLDYRVSSFWAYGDEREEDLKDKIVGAGMDFRPKKNLTVGTDIAWDYDNVAYTLNSYAVFPKLRLSGEFRDIDIDFQTIDGRPTSSGEIGGLLEAGYTPWEWLYLSGDIDVYKDRLFSNPDDPDRLNYNLNTFSNITINPTTQTRLAYRHVDEKGKLSPHVSNNATVALTKSFPELKALSTYIQYGYRDSENPDSPLSDYHSNSLGAGLNLRLLRGLSYYASGKSEWLTEEFTDEESRPTTMETGLDYSSQICTLPLYTTLRINYRNEENAASDLSFLSGEDSLGFFGELSYRPNRDFELFASTTLRNFWAENPDTEERVEAELRLGGKLFWDTDFRWNPVGTVEGAVYRDINDDGTQQDNEPGESDVKIFAGEKEIFTDADGFYSVSVKGKKVTLNVDSSSLPAGYVISDAGKKELQIKGGEVIKQDFRLISRSEIYGVIFEDKDGDGRFDVGEIGIPKVVLTLEDGKRAVTDAKGQYYFRKIVAGEHTVKVDIGSIPIDYLPQVPLIKKITLFEGITYIHNVPLKRAQ